MGKRSVWAIVDNLGLQGVSFLLFGLLARWLSPSEFGLIVVAHSLVLLCRTVVYDGVAAPVLRLPDATDRDFDWLFTLSVTLGAGFSALMLLLAWLLAAVLDQPDLQPVTSAMAVVVMLFAVSLPYDVRLVRAGNFKRIAIRSMSGVLAGGAVALAMAAQGMGVWALVMQQVVMFAVIFVVSAAFEWRHWRPRWYWCADTLRQRRSDIRHVAATNGMGFLGTQGDAVVVSLLLGPHATGLYNMAKRVTSALYLVIGSSIVKVAMSLFVQARGDVQVLKSAYLRTLRLALVLIVSVFGVLFAMAPDVLRVVFGPVWAEGAPVVQMMVLLYTAEVFVGQARALLVNMGHAATVSRVGVLQMVCSALAAYAFYAWGSTGVAAGFALGALVGMVGLQWEVWRRVRYTPGEVLGVVGPPAGGVLVAVMALEVAAWSGWQVTGWGSLLSMASVGVLSFAVVAAALVWLVRRREAAGAAQRVSHP